MRLARTPGMCNASLSRHLGGQPKLLPSLEPAGKVRIVGKPCRLSHQRCRNRAITPSAREYDPPALRHRELRRRSNSDIGKLECFRRVLDHGLIRLSDVDQQDLALD